MISIFDYQKSNTDSKFAYLMRHPTPKNQIGKDVSEVVIHSFQFSFTGTVNSWLTAHAEILYNPEQIESLVKEFQNTIFIIDEAYYEYAGITCSELVKHYDNLVILRTFSKTFSIAGLRMGYVISSRSIKKNLVFISFHSKFLS